VASHALNGVCYRMKSHELPIPPEKALHLAAQASARAMTPARPLPKLSPTRRMIWGGFYAALTAAIVWLFFRDKLSVFTAVPLIACLLAVVLCQVFRGCPDCKHRLKWRREEIHGTSLYRDLYVCAHCHAVWDGGTGDHEKEGVV
jgi:hypothetical protein